MVSPGTSPRAAPVNPYLLPWRLAGDAVIGYHTALELHRRGYSPFQEHCFFTTTAPRPLRSRGQRFRASVFARKPTSVGEERFGVELHDRRGLDLAVTGLKRTLVGLLDRPDLGGGTAPVSMPGDPVPAGKTHHGGHERTPRSPGALALEERRHVHETLSSAEVCNQPPVEVCHPLLERDEYLCSVTTMLRTSRGRGENGERRDQRAAQHHAPPRLATEATNDVWTSDCSTLPARARSVYLTLYVVLDLFSRFALAWMVSRKENSALAQQLMAEAAARCHIDTGQPTITKTAARR